MFYSSKFLVTGSRQVRRHPARHLRRRPQVLAAQAPAARLALVSVARSAKPEPQSHDPRRRGRHIRGREGHAIEEGRRARSAGHPAEDTGPRARLQVQSRLFRQVLPSRHGRGESGGRHDTRERRQVIIFFF